MDIAGTVVDTYAHTGVQGSRIVAKVLLNGQLKEPVLQHLATQANCDKATHDAQFVKLWAQTPLSNEKAAVLAQNFLALVGAHVTSSRSSNTKGKIVSIDRGRRYQNRPRGLRKY